MKLHLRYRLWIAEMNEDITVLRIFDDHLAELAAKKQDAETTGFVNKSKEQFADFRRQIDELKHEMHLHKMNIAAFMRDEENARQANAADEEHVSLQKRYIDFRERFDKAKQVFAETEQ
ncbi:hypothetical protein I5907_01090 [Panacibacter sp. DH6]|uniref:Uncharacterized protein n=1 Tax=Panacibacter microcysteis TaxID=2793269 RepID=A0A931E4G2_9BACT|nr:hypothetical protein [Panacibacter microcysteis]MBG9374813.1 hypothetical protein [Panacibacter microcysteis]